MANSEYNYIPMYIRRTINNRPKDVVTSKYWNELFNLLITQGDHTAEAVANVRGAFRINVTSSNGVYTADKTFDEIKAAYDAGQLPYVVLTGGTFDLVYTLADFDAPTDGSEPKFVDFERYLIGEDTLETEMLRIYSYTLANGSNIVKRTSSFDVPSDSVVIEGTASDDMSAVTITTPDAWTLVSEAWNSEKRPLVVLRLSDDLCAYLTSVSTITVDGQSTGMALFFLPPLRHLNSTPPYSIWLDESGGAAILPVESAVKSVNGKTGAVVLNASDVGAQRPLIAGSGITIVESEDGDIIQSDVSGGDGVVSFVDVAGGAPIAQFTLNQTQDCEINVNDLIQTPLLNNYRTAAAQDVIDAGKQDKLIAGSGITITPSDNGDIIQSDASGSVGNGLVSFVDVADGAPIASFTLNQMQDCEINVNDLTAHLHNKFVDLETSDHKL